MGVIIDKLSGKTILTDDENFQTNEVKLGDSSLERNVNTKGTMKYTADDDSSHLYICMRTGDSTYEWLEQATNAWVYTGQSIEDASLFVENTTTSPITDEMVTFGQVFVQGDVSTGNTISMLDGSTLLDTQVDVKARYSDDSIKHAIITVPVSVSATSTKELSFNVLSESPQTPISLVRQDLVDASFEASISATISGTTWFASAIDILEDSSTTWLNGPNCKEWIISGPLKNPSLTEHDHLQAYFHIRAYSATRIRVDVILENNWTYETSPGDIDYDLSVHIGATEVLAEAALTHYHHARWKRTFWFGDEQELDVQFDTEYLKQTRAIPNYNPNITISETALAAEETSWSGSAYDLMNNGVMEDYMPATGGRPDIGPLPRWSARYLISMDSRAKQTTFQNADQAGSWGTHYRNKDTGEPVTIEDYPYITILGNHSDTYNPITGEYESLPTVGTSGTPYTADSSHQPSLAFVPYMLSGDYYYLEELQFWCNYNLIQANPNYRNQSDGLLKWDQVRGQGWSLRTLAQAAWITPDDHTFKSHYENVLTKNQEWYEDQFVNGNNAAATDLGWIPSPIVEGGKYVASPWMDDFFTYAVGYTVALGYSDWQAFFEWKSIYPVGRMTSPYCWIFAAPYRMPVDADASGTWYTTFEELYDAVLVLSGYDPATIKALGCATQELADHIGLDLGEMTGYAQSGEGYPANMQPALAAAAESGITGSSTAWTTFDNRAVKWDETYDPQFAIVPYTT